MTLQRRKNSYKQSPVPEGTLFQHLQAKKPSIGNEQIVCSMAEPVEIETLKSAWRGVAARHEALRTSFHRHDSEKPYQCLHREISLPWKVKDLRALSGAEQENELNRRQREDRENAFGLDRAPLFRLNLFRLTDEKWNLTWSFPQGILDGRSVAIVLTEVFRVYDAKCRGEEAEIAPARPYTDYLEFLKSLNNSQAEEYWRKILQGFTGTTSLSALEASDGEQGLGEEEVQLSKSITQRLAELESRERFTVQNAVEAAWALVLSRYNGNSDVVFGTTRACRGFLPRAGSMVGTFMNTLPVRVRVAKTVSVFELLRHMRSSQIAMRDYEHTPLSQIQSWSELPDGSPLFESVVVSNQASLNWQIKSAGLPWANREVQWREHTNFPLSLYACAEPELSLRIAYDRKRFGKDQIQQALANLQIILEDIASGVDKSVVALQTRIKQDRHNVVEWWTATTMAKAPKPPNHNRAEKPAAAKTRPNSVAAAPAQAVTTPASPKAACPALPQSKPAIVPPVEDKSIDKTFLAPIEPRGGKPALAENIKSCIKNEIPAAVDPKSPYSPDSFLFQPDWDADLNRSLELFAWAAESDENTSGSSVSALLEKNLLALRSFSRDLLNGAKHAADAAAAGLKNCSAKRSVVADFFKSEQGPARSAKQVRNALAPVREFLKSRTGLDAALPTGKELVPGARAQAPLCEFLKTAQDRIPRPDTTQEPAVEPGLVLREPATQDPAGKELLFTPSKRQPLLSDVAPSPKTERPAAVDQTLVLTAVEAQNDFGLVPIQPNGKKPAIFCIGALDDDLKVFHSLSAELGSDQPVWGLNSLVLENDAAILTNVKKIASNYIDQLRSAGHDHPYCLAGHSFGGLVALEMAQQLSKSGVEVPALVLLDTYYERGRSVKEKFYDQIHRSKQGIQRVLAGKRAQSAGHSEHHSSHTSFNPMPGLDLSDMLQAAAEISKLQQRAADGYRARQYPGRACIFTVSNPQAMFDGGEHNGWDRIFNDSISIYYEIPGDRGRINTTKHAALVARRFREFFGGVEEFSPAPALSRTTSSGR